MSEPGFIETNSLLTTRVRSTTLATRLLVPRARTEQALVRMAGATTAVRTAKGFSVTWALCRDRVRAARVVRCFFRSSTTAADSYCQIDHRSRHTATQPDRTGTFST